MSHFVKSWNSLMAVDLNQGVHHPLILLPGGVSAVLQHQPGLGDPDRVGYGESYDALSRESNKLSQRDSKGVPEVFFFFLLKLVN